ncbi:hypothetical protein ElyMa_002526100 [Elysia marginata]|uniref:C-type lectin domain-containing protein n=1 Tax=Elysia marginata TaxID=1093978 RepID=A0AAV4GT92_9GAST|nr:hypothetical protein ElyMa_002526100 [Elysia marginata]
MYLKAAYFNWADPAKAANRSGSLCAMKTIQTTDQGRWQILKCDKERRFVCERISGTWNRSCVCVCVCVCGGAIVEDMHITLQLILQTRYATPFDLYPCSLLSPENRFVKVDDICARTSSASLSWRLTRELNGSSVSCCAFGSGNFVSCSDSLILDLEADTEVTSSGLNLLTIAIILVPVLVSLALCWKNTKPNDRMKEEALMEMMKAMVKAHNQKVPGMPTSSDVLKTTAGKQDATTTLLAGASNSTLKKPGPASATDFFERLRHGSFFSINLTDKIDEGPVLFNMGEDAKSDEKLAGSRRGSYV